MSRIDKPTLKCDRCGHTTQDTREMGRYKTLKYHHMSGSIEWDLCESCWDEFIVWTQDGGGAR